MSKVGRARQTEVAFHAPRAPEQSGLPTSIPAAPERFALGRVLVLMSARRPAESAGGCRAGRAVQAGGPPEGPLREAGRGQPKIERVMSILDPRMEPLVHAAHHWRKTAGPDRVVIDQFTWSPTCPRSSR